MIGSITASHRRPTAKTAPIAAGASSSTSVANFRKKNWTKKSGAPSANEGGP
jgi:hypothetical protein